MKNMNNKNIGFNIKLTKEEKEQMIEEIKYYFSEERDEELGIIASENLLDFFLNTMGKYVYNKALDDTKYWFDRNMDNIESDFYALYK